MLNTTLVSVEILSYEIMAEKSSSTFKSLQKDITRNLNQKAAISLIDMGSRNNASKTWKECTVSPDMYGFTINSHCPVNTENPGLIAD